MNIGRASTRPSRAFVQLLALTSCVSAAGHVQAAMPKFAFAVIVTVIAVSKVRLVVLDFLGERQHRSPIGPALIAWASAVLAIALTKALMS